jgi:hypothetical protein
MLARVLTIAMNTYREAVRARVLHGLFALAIATSAYAVVVGNMSLHQESRVIADIGAASISLYAVLVAIVLGATSLHRELELKTIFPILSRPLRRYEYLLGKYVGTLLTLAAFVAIDAGVVLGILTLQAEGLLSRVGAIAPSLFVVLGISLWRARLVRVYVILPWAAAFFVVMFLSASKVGAERQVVVASAALTMGEVAIVTAIATLFASFSSPFLTTIFTIGVFVIGRSADTLAHIPPKVFGEGVRSAGAFLARVFPNLHLYVPARPLLLGQVADMPVGRYVLQASGLAVFYATALLVVSALIFQKRDFQ